MGNDCLAVLLLRSFFQKGLLKRPKKDHIFLKENTIKRPFSQKRRPKLTFSDGEVFFSYLTIIHAWIYNPLLISFTRNKTD